MKPILINVQRKGFININQICSIVVDRVGTSYKVKMSNGEECFIDYEEREKIFKNSEVLK
jgi:hypothetical protein